MTLQARLQRATKGLSPLQRAVLVLRAHKEGRDPEPELLRIDDEQQRRAFNRYLALLWVSNHHLGAISSITFHRVDLVAQAKYHADLLSEAAALMEAAEGVTKSRGFKDWRKRPSITGSELLRSLALESKDEGVRHLLHLWKEVSALDLVRQDLAADFEGEDTLLPEQRDLADGTRDRLLSLADGLGARKLLVDDDEEYLGVFQAAVNEAFKQLNLLEPYQ